MWSYLRWPETQRRPQRENRHDTSITLTRSTHPPQQTLGITSQVCRRGINLPQNKLTKLKTIVLDGSVKFCQVDNMTFCTQVITRASFFIMAGRPRASKWNWHFLRNASCCRKRFYRFLDSIEASFLSIVEIIGQVHLYLAFLAEKLDFKIKSTPPPTDLAKKTLQYCWEWMRWLYSYYFMKYVTLSVVFLFEFVHWAPRSWFGNWLSWK